jgi:glycosyltransferase involved in cell wall biosynthesis
MAAARNTGLDAAEGEYISFCDSDDYMHPNMLKIMYTEIRRNNCDFAVCRWYPTNEYGKPVFEKNGSYTVNFPKNSLVYNIGEGGVFFLVWNKMYKKSAIASLRFDPKIFAVEDVFFNICAFRFIKKCVMTDAKLYGWRQYPNSSTKLKSTFQKRIKGRSRLTENIYNSSYDSIPLSFEQKRVLCCNLAASMTANTIFNHFKCDNVIYASEQIYDLYSRGFIDISHSKGFLRKIFVVPFIVIGKIRKWFETS